MEGPRLWHYTVGVHLKSIIDDGVIKLATTGVLKMEKPIVWFSYNQSWEETANKGWWDHESGKVLSLNREETMVRCGGLVRIEVAPETAPHDWKTLRELSGMSCRMAGGLYRTAIDRGMRPGDWRGTFEPVPRSKWTAVEVFWEGRWVPVPFEA